MIGAIAAVVLMQGRGVIPEIPILERPVPGSQEVVYQVYVKGEFETARQKAVWQILEHQILQGCEEFTALDVRRYGSTAGRLPRVLSMDGFLRIEVVSSRQNADLVARMVAYTVLAPKLRDDAFEQARAAAKSKQGDPFLVGLEGWDLDFDDVNAKDVRDLWFWLVREDAIRVYVSGALTPGQTAEAFRRAGRGLKVSVGARPPKYAEMAKPKLASGLEASVYELRGDAITPSSSFAAARVLATFALGVGKGSSMFRVLREEKGWSYIQEAVFWPTTEGWVPRLVMFREGNEGPVLMGDMRLALAKDVETWDEQTLFRALKLAQTSLSGEWGQSPFWLDHSGPMMLDQVGKTALMGYLDMVGSTGVTLETWSQTLENVDLETMKEQAVVLLTESDGAFRAGTSR